MKEERREWFCRLPMSSFSGNLFAQQNEKAASSGAAFLPMSNWRPLLPMVKPCQTIFLFILQLPTFSVNF